MLFPESPDGGVAVPSPLPVGDWTVDAAHSLVAFGVRHMAVATVTGRFTVASGEVRVPASGPGEATVRASVDVTSVASGHPRRDELIRSADFLDAARHPAMTFVGTGATHVGEERWRLPGELTIKGVTRPVVLALGFGGVVRHRGLTRAGFRATTTIDRRDFGITWSAALDSGGAVVAEQVRITLEIELIAAEGEGG